jgi:hypothetical protein
MLVEIQNSSEALELDSSLIDINGSTAIGKTDYRFSFCLELVFLGDLLESRLKMLSG